MHPSAAVVFRPPVKSSPELRRILELPRRAPLDLASPRAEAMVELMTSRLRRTDRPDSECGCRALGRHRCITRLLPIQAWALYEAPLAGGLLAPIAVGGGKTLLNILMSLVMSGTRTAALFVPPGLVKQLRGDYLAVREHFRVPSIMFPDGEGWIVSGSPSLHVVPYSRFSRSTATTYLESLSPDLIILDEAHKFKHKKAVSTSRFLRYFAAHPETRLCCWSGSMIAKSILDFSHLSAFALGEYSPLPVDPDEAEIWAGAVDPSDWPRAPGELRKLCSSPSEHVRDAVARRIVDTFGVVASRGRVEGASIVFREFEVPPLPDTLKRAIADVEKTWVRPDGEELVEALEVSKVCREIECGFFYRWRFPGNPDPELVERWFAARKAWNREVRERLKNPIPHLDSPLLLANAAERSRTGYTGDLPVWHSDAWEAWREVKDKVPHTTEAVWLDKYLAKAAAEWALKHRGIVWYDLSALGHAISEISGLPLHGGGPLAGPRIMAERGDRSIVASIDSHATGRDGLQYLFHQQLVVNPLPSGDLWEQLLGRLHRLGQKSDEVITYVPRHISTMRDTLDKALERAKFIEGVTTSQQRLLAADVEW